MLLTFYVCHMCCVSNFLCVTFMYVSFFVCHVFTFSICHIFKFSVCYIFCVLYFLCVTFSVCYIFFVSHFLCITPSVCYNLCWSPYLCVILPVWQIICVSHFSVLHFFLLSHQKFVQCPLWEQTDHPMPFYRNSKFGLK